jgi:hypothetical protein
VAGTRLALLLQGVNDNSLNGGCMCTDVEDSQMWTGDQLCVCLGILDRDPARAKAGGCDLFAKRPVRQVGVRPDSTWLSWQWDQQRSGSISQIQTEACRGLPHRSTKKLQGPTVHKGTGRECPGGRLGHRSRQPVAEEDQKPEHHGHEKAGWDFPC